MTSLMNPPPTLIVALASSWYLTGVIWFVQVVHYPLFAGVGAAGFRDYHTAHTRLTTPVVAAPMLAELLAAALAIRGVPGVPARLSWAGLALAAAAWGSTAMVQVPLHARLAAGFDGAAHDALVATNLGRAALWTAHALVATVQLACWARVAGRAEA
jgi:hypothetical protein